MKSMLVGAFAGRMATWFPFGVQALNGGMKKNERTSTERYRGTVVCLGELGRGAE